MEPKTHFGLLVQFEKHGYWKITIWRAWEGGIGLKGGWCLLVPGKEWRRSQGATLKPTAQAKGLLLGVQIEGTGAPNVGGGVVIGAK